MKYIVIVVLALITIGCGHRERKSRIYVDRGQQYTRSYDDDSNTFVFWLLTDSSSTNPTWIRVPAIPSTAVATNRVIQENEEGEPEGEEVEASANTLDDAVDIESTDIDVDSGSDAGGFDGGDAGGDAGGGDAGGGDGGSD